MPPNAPSLLDNVLLVSSRILPYVPHPPRSLRSVHNSTTSITGPGPLSSETGHDRDVISSNSGMLNYDNPSLRDGLRSFGDRVFPSLHGSSFGPKAVQSGTMEDSLTLRRYHNLTRVPACRLPDELYAEIFRIDNEDDSTHMNVMASVCDRWRAAALETTSLWGRVEANWVDPHRGFSPSLEQIQLRLDRSSHSSIDISISVLGFAKESEIRQLWDTISPNIYRCRSLSIETFDAPSFLPVRGPIPSLTSFQLRVVGGMIPDPLILFEQPHGGTLATLDIDLPLFSHTTFPLVENPGLKQISLVDLLPAASPLDLFVRNAHSVEHIRWVHATPPEILTLTPTESAVPSVANPLHFPHLRSLTLEGYAPITSITNWQAPSLTHLSLHPFRADPQTLETFFLSAYFPNLKVIDFSKQMKVERDVFARFIRRHERSIEETKLLALDGIADLIRTSFMPPNTPSISIQNGNDAVVARGTDDRELMCENLKEVTLLFRDWYPPGTTPTIAAIRSLLLQRVGPPHPRSSSFSAFFFSPATKAEPCAPPAFRLILVRDQGKWDAPYLQLASQYPHNVTLRVQFDHADDRGRLHAC